MIQLQINDSITLICFWLCFSRWLAILFQLPLFDQTGIPVMVKVLSSLVISYAFFSQVKPSIEQDVLYMGEEHFWLLTMFYTVTGLIIGFMVKIIMAIFSSSCNLMAQQMGFGMTSMFDPTFNTQSTPLEQMVRWTILVMILSSGALLPMLKGGYMSFFKININSFAYIKTSFQFYDLFFKDLIVSALLLASPILFTNLFLNVVLGVVARMVPQMNVLMVSFVVNIGLGLLIFLFISDEFFNAAYKTYVEHLARWFRVIV